MAIIAAVMAAGVINIYAESYDNDIWFILATGREIVENGLPYVNPFTIHDGMNIVVQQWLPDVIAWVIFSLFGFIGLGVWMVACIGVLILLLYRLGRILRGDRWGGEWILAAILLVLPGLSAYLSMRPHFYTMITFAALINCLESYRRTHEVKWLAAMAPLVLLHANMHMAMAPFDVVIIVCYGLPDVFRPWHRRGINEDLQLAYADYPRRPLWVAAAVAFALLFVNPYGVSGALYTLLSYGAADYDNYIREMGPLTFTTDWAIDFAVCFVLGILAAAFCGYRSFRRTGTFTFDLPQLVLFFGCGILAFQHVRNVWLGVFFAYPLLVSATAGWSVLSPWRVTDLSRAIGAGLASALITLGMVFGMFAVRADVTAPIKDSKNIPLAAIEYLDAHEDDPASLRLFNHFTSGGFLEYSGYRALIDPRPELLNSAITGAPEDYYFEYVDFIRGRTPVEDYVEKYGFDYLIADDGTAIADWLKDNGYIAVVDGNGYKLFRLSYL